jgi:cell division protein FtsZ
MFNPISFEMPKNQSNAIKVIGVGGGGSNAINYMFQQDISGVDFVICNTDAQALENSPIPNKIQLGADLTEGMGAGANPEIGEKAAQESYTELKEVLSSNSKMVFITAGMGGGTGTGAAPIIAKISKELELLTVGIVTIPFEFEGKSRITQAQKGIERLREHVDALIIINNNKLREVYGNLGYKSGFSKADEVLSTAARGIAEVITHHYKQNIDLNDAKTVLSNSGSAIMGSAQAKGQNRAVEAIAQALDSPLLNDNKITGAKNVLLLIVSGNNEVTLDEIGEINDHIRSEAGNDVNIIMGVGDDETLGDAIAVTIIATGFSSGQQHQISNTEQKKIVHSLEDGQELLFDLDEENNHQKKSPRPWHDNEDNQVVENKIVHTLEDDIEDNSNDFDYIPTTDELKNIDVLYDEIIINSYKEDDFIIHEVEESTKDDNQTAITFDIDLEKEQLVETTSKIEEINVNDATLFHTEADEMVTFNLSEYDEQEVGGNEEKSKPLTLFDEQDEALQFELKIETATETTTQAVENQINDLTGNEESMSPLNASIEEFKKTTEMRKQSLRQYNYSFNKTISNIDEYENEPAYKRMNVELEDNQDASQHKQSRTSVDVNDNEIKLRSNNSFLHDNVD